jgi:acetyl-CoA acetyltransferase
MMGLGPVEAIPLALARAGVELGDVDLWEVNEAFAPSPWWCSARSASRVIN